jgi:N-acetylmuramoyl-L-alanine amidase
VSAHRSPNLDARPDGRPVDMLVLHYTGMTSAQAALNRLCDPVAKVSAHYVIDEDGGLTALVAETARAWHAGAACWRGNRDVNGASIGIELVNPGHEFGYRPFPEAQMTACEALALDILSRWPITARNVVGHSDVAPERKADPGELFDWARLANAGIGLWPAHRPVAGEVGLRLGPQDGGVAVRDLQAALADYGYAVSIDGVYGEQTGCVVKAFQRHFRPRQVDAVADPETSQLLFALLAQVS